MQTSGAEIKRTEKEEYLRKIKFNFRYVENEVSVGHQDRAALQVVGEERLKISGEVWAEDKNL